MANKKRRCTFCKSYQDADTMVIVPAGAFCDMDHVLEYSRKKDTVKRKQAKAATKKVDKARLRELRKRSAWYADLQTLVNQFVKYRDRDEGCCTCGTTNPNIKYDAGHFHTVGARKDIRFELTNIHKQCSQKCNMWGAGMRNEHEKFIIKKYGPDHVAFLNKIRPPLKEQFPNWQDIDAEIIRYRKLLRELGIKPHV